MKIAAALTLAMATTAALAAPTVKHSAAQSRTAVAKALADPARADQATVDARRQTAAVLAFAGVGPGDDVIDFIPGQGYWTRIFTGVVGPKGHVYAIWPGPASERAQQAITALQARNLPNVTAMAAGATGPVAPQPVDVFWTVQNYHDIPAANIAQLNSAVFAALKPGGTYLIVDHADAPGAVRGEPFKHRIDPAVVRTQVTAAGFRFEGASNVLANPADDHSKSVFDPALRGHTDQFVFKFRKP